jgi:3-methyladenine DNA glycosylase AlkD
MARVAKRGASEKKRGKAVAKAGKPKPLKQRLADALLRLERKGSKRFRDQLQTRFAITAKKAFGASMADVQRLAKAIGPDHKLAQALWKTGWHEARALACYIDDPALVTGAQMDAWRGDFDNWAVCDTACFALFDRTPRAFAKVKKWAKLQDEFGKRAAFALLASLALHDKKTPDPAFLAALPLIERAAKDERNFVKKGVSWALRAIGRRNVELNKACLALAFDLARSNDPTERWIGKDALKDLSRPLRQKRA